MPRRGWITCKRADIRRASFRRCLSFAKLPRVITSVAARTLSRGLTILSGLVAFLIPINAARGAEGQSSYYFPGTVSFGTAFEQPDSRGPSRGVQLISQGLLLGATVNHAIHAFAAYELNLVLYTLPKPVLGAQFQFGGYLPIGFSRVSFEGISQHDFGFADIGLIPVGLYWHTRACSTAPCPGFHFKLAEGVFLPTGRYSSDRAVSVGRNYYAFDTSLAASWFSGDAQNQIGPLPGTEITVVPGILLNERNTATDYRTGSEFHADFMINQFLNPGLAVGAQGYYYDQVSDDTGAGAIFGPQRGRATGVGPALLWQPIGGVSVVAKWLIDLHAVNRPKANYGQATVALVF